jgi:hypothetical protein
VNRRQILAAGVAALLTPEVALARPRDKTIPYVPEDARPYYDPIYELREGHVDRKIWPAVKRINESGWVWTAESCQGHVRGFGHVPMLRLVCREENMGKMLAALALSQSVAHKDRYGIYHGEGRLELQRRFKAPKGWYEIRVWVRRGGVSVFERFAERIQ